MFKEAIISVLATLAKQERLPMCERIQGPNSISACQIWLLNSASNFLCAWGCEQLSFREAALFEEAIQRGRRDGGFVLAGRQGQFAQQGRVGAMWVFTPEAFDEAGQLRGDGAGLAPVLTRLGSQRLEAAMAVAPRPIQQRIDGNRRAFRVGDVVVAGGTRL